MEAYFGGVWAARFLLQRSLAALYLIAFIVVLNQFKPLLGERGLLPVPDFVRRVGFWQAPSLFYWRYSDRLLDALAWGGIGLSFAALSGLSEAGPIWASIGVWLVLWFIYLSIINTGQTFYAFGWEAMLVEAGFFAAFLGPAWIKAPLIPVLILRWMLFRTEIGAGLIKLRHDRCWRELTCLFYHYETQPLPNPLSWYFHRLPKAMHRFAVLFSHFVQLIVPFGLFAPQPVASIAGALIIFHQLWLIVSGNYSWLNWLTVVLGFSAFSDGAFAAAFAGATLRPDGSAGRPVAFEAILFALAGGAAVLSIQPVLNLFSPSQLMNYSYNRFHLVNTYGAFGSVTKQRYEVVIEGADDPYIADQTRWREYEFKGKPGDPARLPPQIAPYHLRLDWLMWFLPFSVAVGPRQIHVSQYERWFIRFVQRLLEADGPTLKLLRGNPFPDSRPRYIRALFYSYRYTTYRERKETGAWWTRRLVGVYLPPVSLADFNRIGS